MYCVRTSSTAEEIIKKSRFISHVIPCTTSAELNTALHRLSAEHPNASHIAFAFRIKTDSGIVARFADAGEPTGTAGKPIYQHIEGREIINCLIAVIRYFGGTKLGAGGLTRAYGNAAKNAIDRNTLVPYIEYLKIPVTIDYPQLKDFEYRLTGWGGMIESRIFSNRVEMTVKLPKSFIGDFKKLIAGYGCQT